MDGGKDPPLIYIRQKQPNQDRVKTEMLINYFNNFSDNAET